MQPSTRSLWLALLVSCTPKPDPGLETGSESGSAGSTGVVTEAATTEPTSANTGASTETGVDGSTGAVTASSTAVDATTSTGTGDGTTTSGTTSGDTGDLPDTTGGEACVDAMDASNEWSLDVPPALVGEDLSLDCTLVDVKQRGPDNALDLACLVADVQETITVHYTVAPDLEVPWFVDTPMHLEYRVEQPFWKNEWLAITGPMTLYLGAVRADSFAPPGFTAEEFYKRDITVHAPCDPVPDACGSRQALALGFIEVADGRDFLQLVKSGEFAAVGVFIKELVFLERASRLIDPVTCDDAPARWFDAMLLLDVSGA